MCMQCFFSAKWTSENEHGDVCMTTDLILCKTWGMNGKVCWRSLRMNDGGMNKVEIEIERAF